MKNYLRLVGYVKKHIWILAVAAVFMVLSSLLQPISLGALIPFIDKVLIGKDIVVSSANIPPFINELVAKINTTSPQRLLGIFLIFYVVIFVLRAVFSFFQQYLMREVSQRVVRDIRNIIYEKLLSLSLDFYSQAQTGTLASRVLYDSTILQDSVAEGLTDLILQSFLFIFSLIMVVFIALAFHIDYKFIITALVIIPMIAVPLIQIGKKLRQISKRSQEAMAGINNILYESISGIRIVKGFGMEEYEAQRFMRENETFKKMVMKSNKRILVVSPLTELVTLVSAIVIIWYGGRQVISGLLSLGTLTAFALSVLSLARPINRLSRVHNVNQQALAAASRIFEMLDTENSIKEKKDAQKLKAIQEKIVFSGISFSYYEKDVLKDISFEVRKGDVTALVGPSGAGKTTLVNLIPRFYDPKKGIVAIDGCNLKDVTVSSLRSQIGIVTQDTILFNDTVLANITCGAKNYDINEVVAAARAANAHNFIIKMPQKYESIVGEKGFKLSGGEKQRIAIARAIYKNPPILIFDEATSQLDSESEKLVQEAIDRLLAGRTVFVIAHRLSTIKHAGTIIVMEEGRIVDKGSHQELINRAGLYKKLYNMQFSAL